MMLGMIDARGSLAACSSSKEDDGGERRDPHEATADAEALRVIDKSMIGTQ